MNLLKAFNPFSVINSIFKSNEKIEFKRFLFMQFITSTIYNIIYSLFFASLKILVLKIVFNFYITHF